MLERQIKIILAQRGLKTSDVYNALDINKVVFYQAIRTNNLNNKTLHKILDFLEFEIDVRLIQKVNTTQKSS